LTITKNPSARWLAVDILNRIDKKGAFAEPLLDECLTRNEAMNIPERRLLTRIVYGTLRMRNLLDWIIDQHYRGAFASMDTDIKNILRTALYQLHFTDRIPAFAIVDEAVEMTKNLHPAGSGLVNAVLRNVIRGKDKITYPDLEKEAAFHISIVHSHPLWLVRRWLDLFGAEETAAICINNNEIPPYTLRINRLRSTREKVAEEMTHRTFSVKNTVFSPDGLVISNPADPVRESELYKSGVISVQDEASQLISWLVNPRPGETILDMCSGVGGKATHMAEIMENRGRIIALDISGEKTKSLINNTTRQGVSIVEVRRGDAAQDQGREFHEAFDKILLDAPCSGTGTLKRNPEIKWRISGNDVKKMVALQKAILKKAVLYLKKGGRLIYSTCSMLSEENESVIKDIITSHSDFKIAGSPETIHPLLTDRRGYFRTFPHRHDMDGFFGAVLIKKVDRKGN
jgi:16S rRNA (cytosine967-C5)-methyltransferase